jgi:RHH-type proline utilization regulon transcriptional repressor/proline dehydrogenase/delta 1-pyrroline-5-carboxylate dehydrogenase
VPLIAETGGQNALIADSSALPEQIVRDVLASAFNSAGQRCSALRVLFVQADIADRVGTMLAGAMQELRIGDPADLRTDVGPVIDEAARKVLVAHASWLDSFATPLHTCALDEQATATAASSPRAPTKSTACRASNAKSSGRSCTSSAGAATISTRSATPSPAPATA